MSTDPQDPQDPQDPADPPAPPPIAPPARTEPPEPAERPESGGDDLSDPTFELELDSAITEEVAEPPAPQPVPLHPSDGGPPAAVTGFEPVSASGGTTSGATVPMGRLFRFALFLGVGLGVLLAIPWCGDLMLWLLPPIFGGVLLVLMSARWAGPAALTTRDVSLAGATIGVIMGGLMTMGLGLRLFMNPELLGPELRELSKSGMNSGLALTLCMVCMLVVVQFTYALLAMIAARWTLAKLSDPS